MRTLSTEKVGWGLVLVTAFLFLTGCTDITGPGQEQNSVQVSAKSLSAQSGNTAVPDSTASSKIKIAKVGEVTVNAEFATKMK